ncbi:unnamed protein product [Lactuca saligna]|uniref:Uncharacterized protein n=1 Tax=Lactuca saligna TaxID=75948 RepID=A0AA35YQ41_LACSI|nr:unnamed protein product [Lactuca saligna]
MFSLFNRFAGFARLPLTPTIDVQSSTITTTISLYQRCLREVRKLAAGGGHYAVLIDACSLKDFCEFQIEDCVTPCNASMIEDVAYRTGSDALVRLCERLRNPLWLLVIFISYLLAKALWVQLDISGEFRNGAMSFRS